MDEQEIRPHLGMAHAGWWIAHRLLATLVEKGLLSHQDVIQILQERTQEFSGGGPTNKIAALLLEQIKTNHEKATGVRSN